MTVRQVDATKQSAADNNLTGGALSDPEALQSFLDDMALKINQIGADNGDMATLTTTSKITAGAINELRALLGGKKIQSGTSTTGAETFATDIYFSNAVITFPIAFSSPPVVIPIQGNGSQRIFSAYTNPTITGVTITLSSTLASAGTNNRPVQWIAIGN